METNFWTPKSIFKGKRADGSNYKVAEWEFGSIGSLTNENDGAGLCFIIGLCLFLLTLSITTPLLLLYCIFTYNGKIQKASVFAIISASYFLFDLHKKWVVYIMNNIAFKPETLKMLTAITIASLVCHIVLVVAAIITKGDMYDERTSKENKEKNTIILFFTLLISFIVTYNIFA